MFTYLLHSCIKSIFVSVLILIYKLDLSFCLYKISFFFFFSFFISFVICTSIALWSPAWRVQRTSSDDQLHHLHHHERPSLSWGEYVRASSSRSDGRAIARGGGRAVDSADFLLEFSREIARPSSAVASVGWETSPRPYVLCGAPRTSRWAFCVCNTRPFRRKYFRVFFRRRRSRVARIRSGASARSLYTVYVAVSKRLRACPIDRRIVVAWSPVLLKIGPAAWNRGASCGARRPVRGKFVRLDTVCYYIVLLLLYCYIILSLIIVRFACVHVIYLLFCLFKILHILYCFIRFPILHPFSASHWGNPFNTSLSGEHFLVAERGFVSLLWVLDRVWLTCARRIDSARLFSLVHNTCGKFSY